mgnify:CR=1 FL=1
MITKFDYKQKIIDVCCGSRMFWFDKKDKRVLFTDIRKEKYILCDGRKLEIKPDILMDFRKLDFDDKSFQLVVFDPPHLKRIGKTSWMAKKYGILSDNWENDLRLGFTECFRILKNNGVLIFKWSERDILIKDVLKLTNKKPLFGHPTRRGVNTMWICFIK